MRRRGGLRLADLESAEILRNRDKTLRVTDVPLHIEREDVFNVAQNFFQN